MTERALKSMGRRINQCIDIFVTQLGRNADAESGWTPAVNMSELADHVAFDILGDLVFGEGSFQMLTSRANRYIVDLIVATSYWALLVVPPPLLCPFSIATLPFEAPCRERLRLIRSLGRHLSPTPCVTNHSALVPRAHAQTTSISFVLPREGVSADGEGRGPRSLTRGAQRPASSSAQWKTT